MYWIKCEQNGFWTHSTENSNETASDKGRKKNNNTNTLHPSFRMWFSKLLLWRQSNQIMKLTCGFVWISYQSNCNLIKTFWNFGNVSKWMSVIPVPIRWFKSGNEFQNQRQLFTRCEFVSWVFAKRSIFKAFQVI